MNSIMMWGLRDPDGQMHIVDTMAQAYVTQKQNPGWEAFILRIPPSGFYEIERGPVQILQRRRLYGDPTQPIFSKIAYAVLAINLGYALSEFLLGGIHPIWLVPIIMSIVSLRIIRRQELIRLEIALLRGRKFFSEVCTLAGDDFASEAVTEWWTKGESDNDKHHQDTGQPEGNREDCQRDAN